MPKVFKGVILFARKPRLLGLYGRFYTAIQSWFSVLRPYFTLPAWMLRNCVATFTPFEPGDSRRSDLW
ncbi:hypothetical protein FS749_001116 [Ceratobasidium sp. UAMH 11750]|nr:hypothetical protein FS749_001116 [Ceratobasidium sp. UAMH 11750]